ncbi:MULTISPECIES: DUF6587 family protein [unclassified Lysobacter]|uniref:DUF6587 family protein n=1 Tax=unclassified Lysobacter TaxID=2635362 RepID=UPI001BE70272|nr:MULTISPECIES: DUF6587 family protein [unclassified Lysobacter]MBT2746481.1 hypothetical protein [Lysobacter sp. ISL-42]MBT2752983.1 hypothetical protein [Lysobacter sp. ISL-50]MBT2777660.1 hypothetical protein [Lysobacter sp. ISL-54]MBT2782431.1 hypothetical protein [Lysobacter sp. ISL-52]
MSAGLFAQYVVVAIAVLISAVVVARKQFPGGVRRLRIACALPLVREGRPRWMRSLGKRIAPAPSASGPNCAGCDNCGPSD